MLNTFKGRATKRIRTFFNCHVRNNRFCIYSYLETIFYLSLQQNSNFIAMSGSAIILIFFINVADDVIREHSRTLLFLVSITSITNMSKYKPVKSRNNDRESNNKGYKINSFKVKKN